MHIDVSLSRRTLWLRRGGTVLGRIRVGIGSSVSPTPTGPTRCSRSIGGPLGAVSAGCLHAPERALRFLMKHVPLGTRVTIRA